MNKYCTRAWDLVATIVSLLVSVSMFSPRMAMDHLLSGQSDTSFITRKGEAIKCAEKPGFGC